MRVSSACAGEGAQRQVSIWNGGGGGTCPGKGTQPTPLSQMKELGAGEKCEAVLCQLSSQRGREMTLLVRQRIAERR